MLETTIRHKYCENIYIKKQRRSNHGINQVSKGIVVFGTIQHRSIIISKMRRFMTKNCTRDETFLVFEDFDTIVLT